ncbi:hypothetical protein T439DRAFT_355756 [Meredithblackwellia eburnea MCA 4105]
MPVTDTKRAKKGGSVKKRGATSANLSGPKRDPSKKAKSSNYNKYINDKMAELKSADPSQSHKDRMKAVLEAWRKEEGQKAK